MHRRSSINDPFTFSFGKLKKLLIDEEVITSKSQESDIRKEIQIHITDESVLNKPVKYQMAWLVSDLGLVRDLNKKIGGPPSSRPSISEKRGTSSISSQDRNRNPIRTSRSSTPSRGSSIRSATPEMRRPNSNLKVDTQKNVRELRRKSSKDPSPSSSSGNYLSLIYISVFLLGTCILYISFIIIIS